MIKKIILIVLGSLFAVVAVVVILFYVNGPFVGFPGSRTADGSRAVTDGGVKITGWNGEVDPAEEKAGMSIRDARLSQEGDALHATTGPAVAYWMNGANASGDYTVKATFYEPKYMNLNRHPHPYGVFIGGNDMGTPNQTDLYCAAYGNGKFIVRGFGPAPFKMNGFLGDVNAAVHKAAGRGQPVTQDIALSVKGNKVECSINVRERAQPSNRVATVEKRRPLSACRAAAVCDYNQCSRRSPMGSTRRTILVAGAAAAAVPRLFAQSSKGTAGKFYEKGPVRIYYEEAGSGFPLLLIPGGGLNSTISFFSGNSPFNAIEEFKREYRCITADLRNAPSGQSTGPVEVDRPWESYADDQLGLMDHLGLDKFMVMGFCIGGPFIWSLLKRAPNRIAAAVLAQPVGWRPEMRDPKYPGTFWKSWPATVIAKRPDITMQTADEFVTKIFETNPDFVFTVTRDFVRSCQNPILVLPDDVPAHPYAVAMECAMLAPKAEVSMFPWKEPKERIPLAVRQIHSFLKAHRPA